MLSSIKKRYSAILFSILLLSLYSNVGFSANSNGQDTSRKYYNNLLVEHEYYTTQLNKTNIPNELKLGYTKKLELVDAKINEYYNLKKELSGGDEKILREIKRDSMNVETSDELMNEFDPTVYADEIGSHVIGLGVSVLNKNFTPPLTLFYEKPLNEKISVGGFLGYFQEYKIISQFFPTDNVYYSLKTEHYRYHYVTAGVKGLYHFIDPARPIFGINPERFDFYVAGMLGFSISSGASPSVKNNKYDKEALKKGINYGFAPGVRYSFGDNVEAFLEVGYGRTGFVNTGLICRFVNRKATKKEEKIEKTETKIAETPEAVSDEPPVKKKLTPKEREKLQKEKAKAAKKKQADKVKAAKAKQKAKKK